MEGEKWKIALPGEVTTDFPPLTTDH